MMKEFIDKLISRLEIEIIGMISDMPDGAYLKGNVNFSVIARGIVTELAEEYKHCDICHLGSPCEYQAKGLAEEYINTSTEHINCSTDTSTKVSEMPTGWIPCSEKQPNKDGYFLVTTSDGEVDVREYDYGNGWGWDGFERIIAWQPIAPYTEGE